MSNMIKMKVTGLTVDPFTNMPIVILKDLDEKLAMPIWIGLVEASSIATELEKVALSRPMTHDLFKNTLVELGAAVSRIEITDLSDNTFHAKIYIKTSAKSFALECRPSDALALALRLHADIFVNADVVAKSRQLSSQMKSEDNMQSEKWVEILENLTDEEFGKYKM